MNVFMFMSRFRHFDSVLQQKCECERGEHVSVTTDKQLDEREATKTISTEQRDKKRVD